MVKVCLRYEAFTGSDVGHGLLVALLVAFALAWMTEVVVMLVVVGVNARKPRKTF